jgi:hypothetical protein
MLVRGSAQRGGGSRRKAFLSTTIFLDGFFEGPEHDLFRGSADVGVER